uniref:Uncharacterized protein n=1 Tax=uncultured marine virus TaxID=186617 RepID=A0A0F7L6R8_9VIRU|nr:hypothetical protein [uncultured marine virus]
MKSTILTKLAAWQYKVAKRYELWLPESKHLLLAVILSRPLELSTHVAFPPF